MTPPPAHPDDEGNVEAEVAVARLLGTLLLTEPTPGLVRELEGSGAAALLRDLGLDFPSPDEAAAFDQLAAGFLETVVHPRSHAPFVQSLVESGVYEGASAQSMGRLAERVGVTFDTEAARGAPIDHLGCQLLLWAELHSRDAAAARAFAERHLLWAVPVVDRIPTDTFHGRLAALVGDFLRTLGEHPRT